MNDSWPADSASHGDSPDTTVHDSAAHAVVRHAELREPVRRLVAVVAGDPVDRGLRRQSARWRPPPTAGTTAALPTTCTLLMPWSDEPVAVTDGSESLRDHQHGRLGERGDGTGGQSVRPTPCR